ncbi:hypothetical protein EON79_06085, partial [bacterium]
MAVVYTTVDGELLHENRGGAETFYVPDPLGSVVQTKDASGTATSETEYWPYGEVQSSTGTNPSPWGYVGTLGYLKDSSERLYVRARYYRPATTRWTTVDPLWPDESAYGYGLNLPTILVDSSGLQVRGDPLIPPFPNFGEVGRCIAQWARDRIVNAVNCKACLENVQEATANKIGNANWGQQNALRHCVGACEATERCGSTCAKNIRLHEFPGGLGNPKDTICDLKNNGVGFSLAGKGGSGNCEASCREALNKKKLCVTPKPRGIFILPVCM